MSFLLMQLLKSANRIEKKLDELLKLGVSRSKAAGDTLMMPPQPLSNPVQGACPLCQQAVAYKPTVIPETGMQVLIRTCGCEPQSQELSIQPGDL